VEPYLQRHPYNNIGFRFPSSPYLFHDFVPSFYHHFNVLEAVDPYLQRNPYNIRFGFHSSPYLSTIFSRLSTTTLTFLEAVEPNLQRHPYTNIRFGFLSSPYISHHLSPSFYHHFNIYQSGGALPPTSPLHQHQILIPNLPLTTPTFFTPLYHHFNIP